MSDQLQHKLANYEVTPPAATWNAIADALEDQSSAVAGRLQNLEVSPPVHLWQQIENELDADRKVPPQPISFNKRFARPLRYGTAVAILVLVAVTITLLLNNDSESGELAQQPTPSLRANNRAEATAESGTGPAGSEQQQTQPINSKEPMAQTDYTPSEKTVQRLNDHRYLTVATETGTPVRLSKKVYAVFDCAEHSTAMRRHQCKQNIESLQKMASSLASPSGDFASLMDMIKTLEENQ